MYDPKLKKEDALTKFEYLGVEVHESRFILASNAKEAVDEVHALSCPPSECVQDVSFFTISLPR